MRGVALRLRGATAWDLAWRRQLACVGLTKTFFNLRDETQPLDGILDRGLFWQGLKCLDRPLFIHDFPYSEP